MRAAQTMSLFESNLIRLELAYWKQETILTQISRTNASNSCSRALTTYSRCSHSSRTSIIRLVRRRSPVFLRLLFSVSCLINRIIWTYRILVLTYRTQARRTIITKVTSAEYREASKTPSSSQATSRWPLTSNPTSSFPTKTLSRVPSAAYDRRHRHNQYPINLVSHGAWLKQGLSLPKWFLMTSKSSSLVSARTTTISPSTHSSSALRQSTRRSSRAT